PETNMNAAVAASAGAAIEARNCWYKGITVLSKEVTPKAFGSVIAKTAASLILDGPHVRTVRIRVLNSRRNDARQLLPRTFMPIHKPILMLLLMFVAAPRLLAHRPAGRVDASETKSDKFALTVDSIMRGPDLVGYPPDNLRWS